MGTHKMVSTQAEVLVFSTDAITRASLVATDALPELAYSPDQVHLATKLYQYWWVCAEENGYCMSVGAVSSMLGMVCLEMARHRTANHAPSPAKES